MYERFFNLNRRPFAISPDPEFLFLGATHATALKVLEYGLHEQDGFVALTGEIGSGKTTLVRHILNSLGQNFQVGLISNTHDSFGDLLRWVVSAFGIEYRGMSESSVHEAFVDYLIRGFAAGKRTLLVVDEAQNLSPGSLEEIRVLSNINADGNQLLNLLLVGQPELQDVLNQRRLAQVTQRISVHYHVTPLGKQDVGQYVSHRMQIAGAARPVFTDSAHAALAKASEGIPRLINQLADMALLYAFADQCRFVRKDTIEQVVADRRKSRLLPTLNVVQPQASPSVAP